MFRYHRDPIWLLIPTVGVCGGHIDPYSVIHSVVIASTKRTSIQIVMWLIRL